MSLPTKPVPEVRQVTWLSGDEVLTGTFRRVGRRCAECDGRNTWSEYCDWCPDDNYARLCTDCGTLERFGGSPRLEVASDFWAEILEQLRV